MTCDADSIVTLPGSNKSNSSASRCAITWARSAGSELTFDTRCAVRRRTLAERHVVCSTERVIRYEVDAEEFFTPLTADQIAEHYTAGRLRKGDHCRVLGEKGWRTIDELFPLLKYETCVSPPPLLRNRGPSSVEKSDSFGDESRPVSSALKAGWICFGLGLAISWFFPLGNVFFSIALITAVVAMCTHQVNRGLILLISSFCASAVCVFVFFALVLGTIGMVAAPALTRMNSDLQQIQRTQDQVSAQLDNSSRAFQSLTAVNAPVLSSFRLPPAPPRPQPDAARAAEEERARTREAVRQAERQRDAINAKQQRIEQLQKSIDWYDEQARQIRLRGGDASVFTRQSEELLRQKWDLQ